MPRKHDAGAGNRAAPIDAPRADPLDRDGPLAPRTTGRGVRHGQRAEVVRPLSPLHAGRADVGLVGPGLAIRRHERRPSGVNLRRAGAAQGASSPAIRLSPSRRLARLPTGTPTRSGGSSTRHRYPRARRAPADAAGRRVTPLATDRLADVASLVDAQPGTLREVIPAEASASAMNHAFGVARDRLSIVDYRQLASGKLRPEKRGPHGRRHQGVTVPGGHGRRANHERRITRAWAKIKAARIPYRMPSAKDLPVRGSGVLAVLYLVFNEGYLATGPGHRSRTSRRDRRGDPAHSPDP